MTAPASSTISGRCQCGACSYEISGPLPPVYACHCLECQRQSGSAFGLSMPVAIARVAIRGEPASWTRLTGNGSGTRCFYCPSCGTRLYHQSDRAPDTITIKPGTLDRTDGLRPVGHLWVSRKQPWVELDPALPAFETQPSDLTQWRDQLLKASMTASNADKRESGE